MTIERVHELANAPEPDDDDDEPEAPADPLAGDEPEAAQPEPDAAPEPEPVGESDADIEKAYALLARSAKTWRDRISKVLGEQANDLYACPLCEPDIPGFIHPATMRQPRDEMQERLFAALAGPETPDYLDAPNAQRCQTCDGYGKVKSGSRAPQNDLIVCAACKGSGYVTKPGWAGVEQANGDAVALVTASAPEPPPTDDVDPWGSPRLLGDGQQNPNYGKMPQYRDPAFP